MPSGIVVIGASSGGLHAVETLLGGLPGDFPRPVAIVQHREVALAVTPAQRQVARHAVAGIAVHARLPGQDARDALRQRAVQVHLGLASVRIHLAVSSQLLEAVSKLSGGGA